VGVWSHPLGARARIEFFKCTSCNAVSPAEDKSDQYCILLTKFNTHKHTITKTVRP
jgi:hypothetical protein